MSLWVTNDVLRQERLNRNAVLARLLGAPMYDVDDALSVTVTPAPVDGVLLSNVVGTLFTATGIANVHALTFRNTDTVARAVNLYLVPAAGSAGVPEQIFADTVQPGETTVLAPRGGWFLGVGGTIQGNAAVTSVVSFRAEVTQYDADPAGLTLKVVDGVALGTSYASLYACPGSGVTHATLLNFTLCNTDASSRAPQVAIVESGDTASAEDEVFGDTMLSKETVIDDTWRVLQPGDFVAVRCAAAAGVVSARATILEAA